MLTSLTTTSNSCNSSSRRSKRSMKAAASSSQAAVVPRQACPASCQYWSMHSRCAWWQETVGSSGWPSSIRASLRTARCCAALVASTWRFRCCTQMRSRTWLQTCFRYAGCLWSHSAMLTVSMSCICFLHYYASRHIAAKSAVFSFPFLFLHMLWPCQASCASVCSAIDIKTTTMSVSARVYSLCAC